MTSAKNAALAELKITVLTPTYNLQYRDVQLDALEKQTFKDFEWIIIDDYSDKPIKASFPIIHEFPQIPVPYCAISSVMNDGLVKAKGKYVFFMNDYVVPDAECLDRHWETQERLSGCLLSGSSLSDNPPPECFCDGNLVNPDYRVGLFATKAFKWTGLGNGLFEIPRAGIQNWWAGRNDRAPLTALLDCTGFDETFYGRWGGQNADRTARIMT